MVDDDGKQLAKLRIGDDDAGYAALLTALAEHGETSETSEQLTPIAIETGRRLLVACLQVSGRDVWCST